MCSGAELGLKGVGGGCLVRAEFDGGFVVKMSEKTGTPLITVKYKCEPGSPVTHFKKRALFKIAYNGEQFPYLQQVSASF